MSSAIQPTENQLPGNSSVLCHNQLCLNRWFSQKVNNYHKNSTLHLIFAVIIHSLYRIILLSELKSHILGHIYQSLWCDASPSTWFGQYENILSIGCIPAMPLSTGVYFLSLIANFCDCSQTYLVKTTNQKEGNIWRRKIFGLWRRRRTGRKKKKIFGEGKLMATLTTELNYRVNLVQSAFSNVGQ